jgi:predicted helicase
VKEILGDYAFDFYEIFLSEYDKSLRSKCGVWYTPQPVVSFIVKAIDEILQKDFSMPRGLADTSTVKITTETGEEKEVPRLQILDPAVGTGTFLAEVIKQTYAKFR